MMFQLPTLHFHLNSHMPLRLSRLVFRFVPEQPYLTSRQLLGRATNCTSCCFFGWPSYSRKAGVFINTKLGLRCMPSYIFLVYHCSRPRWGSVCRTCRRISAQEQGFSWTSATWGSQGYCSPVSSIRKQGHARFTESTTQWQASPICYRLPKN